MVGFIELPFSETIKATFEIILAYMPRIPLLKFKYITLVFFEMI